MYSEAASGPGAVPVGTGLDPDAFRWIKPLAVAAMAAVFITAFQSRPAPGLSDAGLWVSSALAVLAAGMLAVIRLRSAATAVQAWLLAVVVLAAVALAVLQPGGLGFLGVFPAVSAAALHLAERYAALVAAVAVGALSVSGAFVGGNRWPVWVVLHDFAVIAFFILAMFARRHREANDRARLLIAELNETRSAQAEAAALGERQRLAREIHDVLAHSLSGLAITLEGARLISERTGADPQVTEAIARGQRLARDGIAEARRAVGMLRGDALPGPGLLADLAAGFEADTGIACVFGMDGAVRELRPDGRLTVYRVAQEALTNIRKHADPDRVEIRLAYRPDGTELTVQDRRSAGLPPPRGEGTGYGLAGMRERAELLGGALTAAPTADGFRVALWIPS